MLNHATILLVHLIMAASLAINTTATLDHVCNNGGQLTAMYCHHDPYVSPDNDNYPYVSGLFPDLVAEMIHSCCQGDVNLTYHQAVNMSDFRTKVKDFRLNKSTLNYDLVLPLHVNNYDISTYGALHFIATTESFGVAVLKHSTISTAKLMSSLFQAWPVLVFIIITAAIAGIVMWFVEKKGNSKQFSQSFSHGAFDGFWWAFISMTSVGYGDKYPKSIIGRILGSAWIVLGMLFVTMFIGTLTTTLMGLLMEGTYHIKNEKVSVVYGSDAHWLSISQHANTKVVNSQAELFKPLIDYEVDAALLDMNSVTQSTNSFQKKYNIQVSGILLKETYYGIGLRQSSPQLAKCFRDFVERYQDYIFDKLGEYSGTQKHELDPAQDYFGSGGIFSIAVYIMIALFFTLTIVTSAWEIYKWRRHGNHDNDDHTIEEQEENRHGGKKHTNGRVLHRDAKEPANFICDGHPTDDIELQRRIMQSRQSEV